jgi:hypothetical protein
MVAFEETQGNQGASRKHLLDAIDGVLNDDAIDAAPRASVFGCEDVGRSP